MPIPRFARALTVMFAIAGVPTSGSDWILRNDSRGIQDVVWTGSRYVAVGWNGLLATSEDGKTWNAKSALTDDHLTRLAWNGTKMVAISSRAIHTSEDGLNWNTRTLPAENLYDLVWTGKEFVTVGAHGHVYYSVDALQWDSVSCGIDADLDGITWNDSLLVVSDFSQGVIASSKDHKNWAVRVTGRGRLVDIRWTGAEYVAIGADDRLEFSRDLMSWSPGSTPAATRLPSLVWTGSRILSPNWRDSGECFQWEATSGSLGSWKIVKTGGREGVVSLRVHGDRVFGVGNGNITESRDSGKTWRVLRDTRAGNFDDVVLDGTRFLAVLQGIGMTGPGQRILMESLDGLSWRDLNRQPIPSSVKSSIAASPSAIVVAEGQSNGISTSLRYHDSAGRVVASRLFGGSIPEVAWIDSLFVAVGDTQRILVSRDGKVWERVLGNGKGKLLAVAGGGPRMVAVGEGSEIFSSVDGREWTGSPLGRNDTLRAVVWAGTRYVAIGNYGKILTSPDGSAWERQPRASWMGAAGIAWTGDELVVADYARLAHTSLDGIQWDIDTLSCGSLQALARRGKFLVAVGLDGAVVTKGELPGQTTGVRMEPARIDEFRRVGRALVVPAGVRRIRLVSVDGKRSMDVAVEGGRVDLPRYSRGVWIAVESGSSGRAFRFVN